MPQIHAYSYRRGNGKNHNIQGVMHIHPRKPCNKPVLPTLIHAAGPPGGPLCQTADPGQASRSHWATNDNGDLGIASVPWRGTCMRPAPSAVRAVHVTLGASESKGLWLPGRTLLTTAARMRRRACRRPGCGARRCSCPSHGRFPVTHCHQSTARPGGIRSGAARIYWHSQRRSWNMLRWIGCIQGDTLCFRQRYRRGEAPMSAVRFAGVLKRITASLTSRVFDCSEIRCCFRSSFVRGGAEIETAGRDRRHTSSFPRTASGRRCGHPADCGQVAS